MKAKPQYFLFFLFIFTHFYCGAQINETFTTTPSLHERALENQKLMLTELDRAYLNIEMLLEEARMNQDYKIEIFLLANKCNYFFQKEDPQNLINTSEELFKKAVAYNDFRLQSVAKMYLAEALKFNGLYTDALNELEEALIILEKDDSLSLNVINSKSNIYISFANTYAYFEKPEMAIKMMKLGGKEFNKFPEGDYRNFLNYLYHSNLSVYYLAHNIDSSEYHALKSISLKPEGIELDNTIMSRNYFSLGNVYKQKGDYENAIKFLTKVEALAIEIGENVNIKETYTMLIEIAGIIQDEQLLNEYETKFQRLELEQFKSKNQSLHRILEIEKLNQVHAAKQKKRTFFLWTTLITIISAIIILLLFGLYRKKIHSKYEKLSNEYLEKNTTVDEDLLKSYNEIIELVKKG
jgi:tetratricopeptide (TPR) repeat protein